MEKWISTVAVDKNGCIYGYEDRPVIAEFYLAGCDDNMECWAAMEGSRYTYLGVMEPPKQWKEEVYNLNDSD